MTDEFFSRRLATEEDYEVFGLTSSATLEEVSKKYRMLSKIHHPDADGGSAFLFRQLSTAYQRIKGQRSGGLNTGSQDSRSGDIQSETQGGSEPADDCEPEPSVWDAAGRTAPPPRQDEGTAWTSEHPPPPRKPDQPTSKGPTD